MCEQAGEEPGAGRAASSPVVLQRALLAHPTAHREGARPTGWHVQAGLPPVCEAIAGHLGAAEGVGRPRQEPRLLLALLGGDAYFLHRGQLLWGVAHSQEPELVAAGT